MLLSIFFPPPKAFDKLMDYCEKKKYAGSSFCTTGLSEEQLARVEESAKNTPRSEICQHVPLESILFLKLVQGCS